MKRTSKRNVFQVVAGVVFVLALMFGLLFFANILRFGSSYTISAYVSNARGIANDSNIFEAGLPVGLVTGVHRNGPDAILDLRIDHGPTPLPVDSTITVGLRSLAGESDVLLTLGHSHQLVRNGGSLGLSQDQSYTEVDQILNQLSGPTEGKARQFFQGIGAGVNGEGVNLNHTLGGFAALVNNSPPLTSTIGVQHQQVADIVQNLGNIMNEIGQRTTAIEDFARGARTTFQAVAAQDRTLSGFLVHLKGIPLGGVAPMSFPLGHGPAFKAALDTLLGAEIGGTNAERAVGTASPALIQLVDSLTTAVQRLKPSIDLLTPASNSGIKLVNALGGASPALKNLLVNLEQTKPSATQALPALHSLLCQVDPMARFIAPYGQDIASFFESFGGATDVYEQNGIHQLIASLDVDPTEFLRGLQTTPQLDNLLVPLFNFGLFRRAGGVSGFHALTRPGHIGDPTFGVGDQGPTQFGRHSTYPHVVADCTK
jgi:phospholipid/cholesterol/gamma-HCH transport system substrate-binding protein